MTLAERLIEQGEKRGKDLGRQEGRLEGRLEGRFEALREAASRMLARGFGPNEIAEVLGATPDEVRAAITGTDAMEK